MSPVAHRRIGTGPVRVIVLHDWFGTAEHWGAALDCLDPEGFSWALLDYRGYGRRREVPGAYTVPEIAGDVLALADELGWESFRLVGHSMGAKVAQQVLARAPGRVERLLGVAPVPPGPYELDEQGLALFRGARDRPENRRAVIDLVTGRRLGDRWLDAMVERSLSDSLPEAFGAYFESWHALDLEPSVKGSPLPVRLLVGAFDLALDAEFIARTWLPSYPNARIEVLPGTGHYPPHETPVAFAAAVEEFLRD
ncbi:alpha/beta fold hydrolase [Streptomyces sp. BI20]|uniref:alpha/beta fold hydrolase n=1 Tax=Streptomyces sp. BI20 TaxID=3403460 RepID=UPI003C722764